MKLKYWNFPQKGFICEYVSADIRSGGSSLHKMVTPNGNEMWLLTKYEEINEPDGLVFTQYMANEAGEILPSSQLPDWPKELRTRIVLEEVGGKTLLKLIWQPVNPSRKEADCFENTRAEHGKGWAGGLEQLAAYLVTI